MAKKILKLSKKKKKWYSIVAPKEFKFKEVGESLLSEPELLIGKPIVVNLSLLTGDYRNQNYRLKLMVENVLEGKGQTEIKEYYLSNTYHKKMVSSNKEKIFDSFVVETADDIKVKIKPIIIIRNKVTQSVLSSLRLETRKVLTGKIKKMKFEDLVRNVISLKLQKELKVDLKKIYPVQVIEFSKIIKLDKK